MRMNISLRILAVAVIALALPFTTHAESVTWTSPVLPSLIAIGADGPDLGTIHLEQLIATITYGVTVWKLDNSGAKVGIIPSGSAVPVGTRVLLEFNQHQYQDIYWFGTGWGYDSPYGDWVNDAANPSPNTINLRYNSSYLSGLCIPKNLYSTDLKYSNATSDEYATLSVAPPAKSITLGGAPATCTSAANGYDQVCTLGEPGTVTADFAFAETKGKFYAAEYRKQGGNSVGKCQSDGKPMALSGGKRQTAGDYQLTIPQQAIPFSITVTDETGVPPNTPSIVGGPSGSSVAGSSACTTGVPYTITMTAVDPKADTIRYGIDWDGNGIVDQFVPASGYVPSGTAQTATRTFSTDGAKSIKVFAQNSHGFTSAWATYGITCSPAQQNTATSTSIFRGTDGGTDGGGGASISPALNIRAIPSLVSPGKTSNINWSATNVATCTVQGDNGDSWVGTVSPISGETSSPITKKTVYTLTCKTRSNSILTAKATVNILPTWVEQ